MWVKICGITNPEDARLAVEAGADALGLNFVPSSPRRVSEAAAGEIAAAVRGRVELVGVVADLPPEALQRLRDQLGLDRLQLHGSEPPEVLAALLPRAYKALAMGAETDRERAARYPGDRLLLDAQVPGRLGGTGQLADWRACAAVAAERAVVLAGGLRADNVAAAIHAVRPWGVDTASGVEQHGDPRRKDAEKMAAFVRAAQGAG